MTLATVHHPSQLDRGLSVIPGAAELAHIVENMATPLEVAAPTLAPLDGGAVGVSFGFISPKWSGFVQVGGGGSVQTADDGHTHATTLSVKDARAFEATTRISTKHAAVFSELKPLIDTLPRGATPLARRKHITGALDELYRSRGDDALLSQMQVVPFEAFRAHGSLPRRGTANDAAQSPLHVSAAKLPDDAKIIFFSQRWLRREHPDDEAYTKHKATVVAVEAWAQQHAVPPSSVHIWFDFSSIHQDNFQELLRCVNSLGLYIACSDAFVSFAHPEYWGRAWCLAEQMFGDGVRLPRYVLEADQSLRSLDTGAVLKQQLVDPTSGKLTVETDRPVIECLSLVAYHLRARLWFGETMIAFTQFRLEHAIGDADENGNEVLASHGAFATPK